MQNLLYVTQRIFLTIFSNLGGSNSAIYRIIYNIRTNPFVLLGTVLMIVGFSVGLLKRIIHS